MATSIAQRWYLLSGYSCINRLSNRLQVNETCAERNTLIRRCIYLSVVGYRNRGTHNNTQDAHDGQVQVPVDRLTVSYSRSSGPGGQHVNKVSTKAEVRFHVKTADWIAEDVRQKILEKNKTRINKAGELLVTSELSRSQQRNLGDCIQKISDIIAEASGKPYEPTAEDIAIRESRLDKRNKERLKQKKMLSTIKQSRRVDFD